MKPTYLIIILHTLSPKPKNMGDVICLKNNPTYFGTMTGYSPSMYPHINNCDTPNMHSTLDGWELGDLHEMEAVLDYKVNDWVILKHGFKTDFGYSNKPIKITEIDGHIRTNGSFIGYSCISNTMVKVTGNLRDLIGRIIKTSDISNSAVTMFHGGEELPVYSTEEIKSIAVNTTPNHFNIIKY